MAGGEEWDDVGMLQRGGELNLAAEPLGVHPGRHLRGQHFHHHLPPELTLLGEEDTTHPAAAELVFDAVGVAEGILQTSPKVAHRALR